MFNPKMLPVKKKVPNYGLQFFGHVIENRHFIHFLSCIIFNEPQIILKLKKKQLIGMYLSLICITMCKKQYLI